MQCNNCYEIKRGCFQCVHCGKIMCQECIEEYLIAGIRNGEVEFECPFNSHCANIPEDEI